MGWKEKTALMLVAAFMLLIAYVSIQIGMVR